MAAGGTKTYTALFQIGGKLLGSFKGVMQQAEQRLKRLQATARSVGGAFKGLLGTLASFAAGVAGFGIAKTFSNLFSGAVDEAREAEKRFKTIQVTMLKNAQLQRMAGGDQAKALTLAAEQTDILYKHNEVLEKQGVLSEKVYASMERQMSIAGVPTKSILHSVDAMGDLLVAIKGVTANEEEGANLATAMTKALMTGRTKPLQEFGIFMPPGWWKEQVKAGKTYQDMLEQLLAQMKYAKGANIREALTPLGHIRRTENALEKMRKEIGDQMIPIQAQMADMWLKALPELKPAIIPLFKGLLLLMRKLAELVITYLIPAFVKLQAWWNKQTPQQQKRWLLIAAAVAAVGAAFVGLGVALPILAAIVAAVGVIATPVGLIVVGVLALVAAIGLVYYNWDKVKQMFPATAAVIEALVEGFKLSFKLGFDSIKALWATVVALFTGDFTGVGEAWKKVWTDMVALAGWWRDSLIEIAKAVGQAFKDYFLSVFEDIKKIWEWMKGFTWEGVKAAAAPSEDAYRARHHMPVGIPHFAAGGIVTKPTVAQVGEKGPEAIVPLNSFDTFVKATQIFNKSVLVLMRELAPALKDFIDVLTAPAGAAGAAGGFGGAFGGAMGGPAGVAAGAAAAAATAPAQSASAEMALTPEALKAVQAERADVVKDLMRPEIRNLVSATLATEASGAEDQKNVMEALVNRGVAQQRAGTYQGVEALIKGGFYGPYNRGETQRVMAKGLTDARSEQVKAMGEQMAAGRNALGGLTDQGMINEIKGSIKERHGEDYFGKLGIPGETETAAFRLSRQAQQPAVAAAYAGGGIVAGSRLAMLGEHGPEAVIPLSGGRRAAGLLDYASRALGMGAPATHSTSVSFAPSIVIHGNASEAEQRAMDSRLRDLKDDFIKQFEQAQRQERRLSYEGGYT